MGKPFCCFCDFLSTLQCLTQAILSYSQALGQTFNKKKNGFVGFFLPFSLWEGVLLWFLTQISHVVWLDSN